MWALIDCDSFFCSCERVWRPDLIGKPVVVLSNNDGCVVARTPEAKQLGIRMGLPYYQMLEQFSPDSVTAFSSNYKLYGDMSKRVMATIREEVPVLYQYSIDEAFADFTGFEADDLKEWGRKLSAKVLKWTGIPVSIGIAPSKTLAKIATRFAKKYGGYHKCCLIENEEQRYKALRLTETGDVWGIGRRIARHLASSGIRTAYEFSCRSRQWIKNHFHIPGERTWLELNGHDVIGVDEMEGKIKKSIVTSRSFPEMLTDPAEIATHVANYAARCALKLRRQGSACRQLSVFIHSNPFREDLPQYSQMASIYFSTPTNSTIELVEGALNILNTIFKPGIRYKRGGVMVSEFSSGEVIQPDLFTFDAEKFKKQKNLSKCLDTVNTKLGNDTLILASQMYSKVDKKGKSVKFSHAIKRALLSPDFSTSSDAFIIS